MKIPFNKPYFTGMETEYIRQAVASGKISGDGLFTKKCQALLEKSYGFGKTLLTTSCTDALEMAAILCDIEPGDEVIAPSYTFVSTVNAFVLRGAKIVFADSEERTPNLDVRRIEALVTPKTKVIIPVHYAGMACDMDPILELAEKRGLVVVEDAAQAIDSCYRGKPLGSLGHLAAFSFHETKNVITGEGGMLVVNDPRFEKRAEIIREKGTNRSAFFRGEVDKYGWVDIGSSFLPSDIIAAFLYAQLEHIEEIQRRRKQIWNQYYQGLALLEERGDALLPVLPPYATNNAHMFYLVCRNLRDRSGLIAHLKEQGILAVFHYLSLHKSPFYQDRHDGRELPNADRYSDCLVRLPMYYELTDDQIAEIIGSVLRFYGAK
ncbi:dTDP-4-amino-4,6-dideoxygalactose transaminase [Geomonas anaerohicana]|uniref:dTDP-4-amino-4,6-dideoxygalactose transaminase n=1 Tax=Geomonas anaerohicana TaxID=2798583 RepID=A0ABS0YBK8_9BACT|nr:dTDP-4-amino-4,6-dideoxygalactose transaminase [Geomonas anaerohicana]MBJ6749698.1 dTDP-4-amino-4,6-dideoxygalactose transaminase [Geomonas anaerohicana]